ncbi:unnamed protein product [Rhizophagus irregularis]|uniref:Actin-like ATPase domain-containing protein n=1 Tax=Rhizophagus irregularis TaxID=588596 RepID=A0A915ZNA3_9GLOM|nr:unnamed protein product [Rhizophagus irregularis]
MSEVDDDIRVVVAIDFGTTYSGYAYAHKEEPDEIIVQDSWKEYEARFKTPTVIKYNDNYSVIKLWGYPALTERSKIKKARLFSSSKLPKSTSIPIELFKLHLLKSIKESEKPILPRKLNYKNVIRDFMKQLGDDVKTNLKKAWQNLDLEKNVLYILTVPAEFDDEAIATFRECVFNAGLLKDKDSNNIRIITEPEAAAIHCLNSALEHNLTIGDSFMIVDCGGGTVDLTTRELLEDKRLSELTELPPHPTTSVVKGGVLYGLKEETVKDRVLKRTYGTDVVRNWQQSDPLSQKLPDGKVITFEKLVQRGKQISMDEKIVKEFRPSSLLQQKISFDIYVTDNQDVKYCDDPEYMCSILLLEICNFKKNVISFLDNKNAM